jgi:hypothetical protein
MYSKKSKRMPDFNTLTKKERENYPRIRTASFAQ